MADAVYEAVDDWCSLVTDWLEVVFGQKLRSPHGLPRSGGAISPWLWSHDGGGQVLLHNNKGAPRLIGSGGENAVDARALQQVFTAVGASCALPWHGSLPTMRSIAGKE